MSHLWPTGSSWGQLPSTTARYFSACPSDPTSRWTPCPSKKIERWLQVRLGRVRLSSSCPFRLFHTFLSLRPTRRYPRLWIRRPSSGRRRDSNPPDQRAAQRTLRVAPTPQTPSHLASVVPRSALPGVLAHAGKMGPPRFLGDLRVARRGLRPRRDLRAGPVSGQPPYSLAPRCCLRRNITSRLPRLCSFGARSHGSLHSLSTLRSQGCPCATQDSLPDGGQPCPGGGRLPSRGPVSGFQCWFLTSSSPRLGLAHRFAT